MANNILVVDDYATSGMIVKQALTPGKYEVKTVTSGAKALNYIDVAAKIARAKAVKEDTDFDDEPQPRKTVQPKVTPIRQTRKVQGNGMEVCVIKPTSREDTREIAIQVNGKVRATIMVHIDDTDEVIQDKAMNEANVIKHIEGKEIVKA